MRVGWYQFRGFATKKFVVKCFYANVVNKNVSQKYGEVSCCQVMQQLLAMAKAFFFVLAECCAVFSDTILGVPDYDCVWHVCVFLYLLGNNNNILLGNVWD